MDKPVRPYLASGLISKKFLMSTYFRQVGGQGEYLTPGHATSQRRRKEEALLLDAIMS